MKGCLVVVGFVVLGAALALGVVVAVERHGATEQQALTERATEVELISSARETRGPVRRQRDGWAITYRYEAGARTFTSSTWLVVDELGIDVCFDPDDPAVHTVPTSPDAACGEGDLGSDAIRRAEEQGS